MTSRLTVTGCRSREGWLGDGAFVVGVFAAHCFRAMELTTILNRCHRFPGFVYQHARFSPDKKSIEVFRAAAHGLRRDLFALPSDGSWV